MSSKLKDKIKSLRLVLIWVNVALGVAALFLLLMGGAMVAYGKLYEGRIFPGVRVLGVRLDGLTQAEATKAVDDSIDQALEKGLQFRYRGRDVVLDASTVSTDPDASRDLVRYNPDKALETALAMGRRGGWFKNMVEQMRLRVTRFDVPTDVFVDRSSVTEALQTSLKNELTPAKNARLKLDEFSEAPIFVVEAENKGVTLVAEPALDQLEKQAAKLDFNPIELSDRVVTPEISAADIEPFRQQADEYIRRPSLVFTYEKQVFPVPTSTLAGWVTVTGTKGGLELTLDPESFAAGLRKLATDVEAEPKNGSLVIKDGKIETFVPGTEGRSIDTTAVLNDVLGNWPPSSTFPLVVRTVQGTLVGEDPERLGIRELLGVGKSNFSGSPSNRRKNIAHGAAVLNGIIIQPGETFSTIGALGPIDGAHKWLPELVIKGNETKPEYGGGLCQIGTTVFRAALAAGLPIVERREHSYRVRYYEPAGTDATIYDPHPDLRFTNDTGNPILINAYIVGDNVFFEYWGTKDGRKAEQTKPRIYGISSPPPMKLVETLDLAPGKKRCTESAHAGANAEFTYTVTYASGEVKKEVFTSHYRPWQAVCLVGVEKLSTPAETPPADGAAAN